MITSIRWIIAAVSLALALAMPHGNRLAAVPWAVAVVGYAAWRAVVPAPPLARVRGRAWMAAEVALYTSAVAATGRWDSPLVVSLMGAAAIVGFAAGSTFTIAVGGVAAMVAVVGSSDIVRTGHTRPTVVWALELLLIAVLAAYVRRVAGEADRQQVLALDRLGRLADANNLLFSLHQIAQTLPASLNLDEALDSTMTRLRELFPCEATSVLLHDETDGSWVTARSQGSSLPTTLRTAELGQPLAALLDQPGVSRVADPVRGPAVSPGMAAAMYATLVARGAVIGLVVLESATAARFSERDAELLEGLTESAALGIDNARWFARLRMVGAEEERTRIARDLHDRIGQSLAYLAFELDRIVKVAGRGDDVSPALDQLRTELRDVIRDVRDTLYDLRTDVSESSGVGDTLELFLFRVRDRSGLQIDFEHEATARLPLAQEREVFRIAQEAIANIEKHAGASVVTVRWACHGTEATLEVTDDGKGFQPGTSGRVDSYGIIGMRERALSIGATLEVVSAPGAGTTVRCSVSTVGSPMAPVVRRPVR